LVWNRASLASWFTRYYSGTFPAGRTWPEPPVAVVARLAPRWDHGGMRHNEDAALNAARYQMKQEQEPMPADEYAQATGMASVTEPKTPLQIYAQDEAWEVANSVLDEAFARGDFDNLALAGQKIDHITNNDDPDWWLKSMMR